MTLAQVLAKVRPSSVCIDLLWNSNYINHKRFFSSLIQCFKVCVNLQRTWIFTFVSLYWSCWCSRPSVFIIVLPSITESQVCATKQSTAKNKLDHRISNFHFCLCVSQTTRTWLWTAAPPWSPWRLTCAAPIGPASTPATWLWMENITSLTAWALLTPVWTLQWSAISFLSTTVRTTPAASPCRSEGHNETPKTPD